MSTEFSKTSRSKSATNHGKRSPLPSSYANGMFSDRSGAVTASKTSAPTAHKPATARRFLRSSRQTSVE
jgi:hypothetical protein